MGFSKPETVKHLQGLCEPCSVTSAKDSVPAYLVEHAIHAGDRFEVPLLANGVDILRVGVVCLIFLIRTLIKLQLARVTVDHSGENGGSRKLPLLFCFETTHNQII